MLHRTITTIIASLFFLSGVSAAQATEKITFSSEPIQPSPFKVKQAKAKGITLAPKPGIDLKGYLFRPDTPSARPAIITMVSGDGLQKSHMQWGEQLASWGYVNLLIDTFGSRGGTSRRDTPNANIITDAYNGYRYLTKQEYVDPNQIALLGFSLGGSSIFSMLNEANVTRPTDIIFKAGVSIYPNCDISIKLKAPLLILIGDNDPLASHHSCETISSQAQDWNNDITFHLYTGATHFYDNRNYSKTEGERDQTASLPFGFKENHYDGSAHQDTLVRVKKFLKEKLD